MSRRELPRVLVCAWIAAFADAAGDVSTREGYLDEMDSLLRIGVRGVT